VFWSVISDPPVVAFFICFFFFSAFLVSRCGKCQWRGEAHTKIDAKVSEEESYRNSASRICVEGKGSGVEALLAMIVS